MAKENKIATAQAENEFNEWCEANDIDCDTSTMNEEDEKGFTSLKKRIVKAICAGRATINGRTIKYTFSEFTKLPEDKKEVEIQPPNGYMFTAMDGFKKNQDFKRLNAAMAQMTGLADGIFNKMDALDLKFFQAVTSLFLVD